MKKTFHISELAQRHGLSRSTLLYYDRCGLLNPSARSPSGYRLYSEKEAQQLAEICRYRASGLNLDDIRQLLNASGKSGLRILKKRLATLQQEMLEQRRREQALCRLIHSLSGTRPSRISKAMWIDLLRKSGFSEEDMLRWHTEFESSAPEAHESFLTWLGIPEDEISAIRRFSRSRPPSPHHQRASRTIPTP